MKEIEIVLAAVAEGYETSNDIASTTGLSLKSASAYLTELSRMDVIVQAGWLDLPSGVDRRARRYKRWAVAATSGQRDALRTGPYFVATLIALFLTGTAIAQSLEICPSTSTKCVPPPTWKSPGSKPPLDAPVRFGGEEIRHGEKYWRWIRAGNPSRPCTAAETASPVTAPECKAKIGDLLFVNQRFRPKE